MRGRDKLLDNSSIPCHITESDLIRASLISKCSNYCGMRPTLSAGQPNDDQCKCLLSAGLLTNKLPPRKGKEELHKLGVGKGAAIHPPFTNKSPRPVCWVQRRLAKIRIVLFLRDEKLLPLRKCFFNYLLEVFPFIQLNPSLWGKPFSVIAFNVVTVKILSLKRGLLSFTMLPTTHQGEVGGSEDPGILRGILGPAWFTPEWSWVGCLTSPGLGP